MGQSFFGLTETNPILNKQVRGNIVMKWKKIAESEETTGYRRMFSRHYMLPNGTTKGYDIVERGPSCHITAVTKAGEVVMVRQFRPGPERTLTELVAGAVDPGEEPMEAAKRELLEETGYTGDFTSLGEYWISAYVTGKVHSFLAVNCKKVQEPRPEDDEFLEVVLTSLEELRELAFSGDMSDTAGAYRALDALGKL